MFLRLNSIYNSMISCWESEGNIQFIDKHKCLIRICPMYVRNSYTAFIDGHSLKDNQSVLSGASRVWLKLMSLSCSRLSMLIIPLDLISVISKLKFLSTFHRGVRFHIQGLFLVIWEMKIINLLGNPLKNG